MLKLKLDTVEGLDESIAKLYSENEDGTYSLSVEGLEDTGPLKRAKEHEKAQRLEAQRKAMEAEKALQDLQDQIEADKQKQMAKGGKFEELKADFDKKVAAIKEEYEGQIKARDEATLKAARESKIKQLASSFGANPEALEPHIERMVQTELIDGEVVHYFADTSGTKNPLTDDLFAKELRGKSFLADLLKGSEGSGGGAKGNPSGGGAPNNKPAKEWTEQERRELKESNPEQFSQMFGLGRKHS